MMLEQPGVCGAAQGLGARRAAGNAGEVVKQVLPLGTIAAHEAEVSANALKVGEAGLFVARVVGEKYRQQAQLRCQHFEHHRWHIACIG
jgi:hypothetical protein